MRAILLDELRPDDVAKVTDYLDAQATLSGIEGLYWVDLDDGLLTSLQAEHKDCQPHRFAIEVGHDFVKLELFIRSAAGLRCPCAAYASEEQRRFILAMADRLIDELSLKT